MQCQDNDRRFPKGFYWGSATAAHQVEGDTHNDWTVWERANAELLAAAAKARHGNDPAWKFPEAFTAANYVSGRACDHYKRFREDFSIAKSLGQGAHRFSLEWSRIEPEEGKFDDAAIAHYREVLNALHERGLEPFVTLWHFTNPVWFSARGGWTKKDAPELFARYAKHVTGRLGDLVGFWMTLNEPLLWCTNAYVRDKWPPQEKNIFSYFRAVRAMVRAHNAAFVAIKSARPAAQVGVVQNNVYFDGWLSTLARRWWNIRFLHAVEDRLDFIGLNYYFHNRIKGFRFNQNENRLTSDMGWEIFPEGIYRVLLELKAFHKPVYVTENGIADAEDAKRESFIREHILQVHRAIKEGVDVRGYFYWSLLDNFEWDKGFWPRFGLVEIDHQTLERRVRPSALAYKKICEDNAVGVNV